METLTEIHYLSILLIGIGSFIFGILPVIFSFRVTRSHPFFISLTLCLGAGILLATSLVHMLTEVQVKLKLSAQLYFCIGLLTLYTFDEINHLCVGGKNLDIHLVIEEYETSQSRRSNYGAMHSTVSLCENSLSFESNRNKNIKIPPDEEHSGSSHSNFCGKCYEERNSSEVQQSLLDTSTDARNNTQNQVEPHSDDLRSSSSAAKIGLLMALLIHSILEGISVGVQTKISQVLIILGAVTFHKIVLSFCLGLELYHQGFKFSHLLTAIFIFSMGSPIGILLGLMVTSFEKGFFDVDAQLQAIAAGSLLYIAAFEVLPRERFKWQHKPNKKVAGILQLIFVFLGFTCITIFHFFVDFGNDENKNHGMNVSNRFG